VLWATAKSFSISGTHFYKNESLPKLKDIDWLIIMGGSMSVNEEEQFPWLVAEKAFVKSAIDAGKVVLGICLGAQMIANILGSKVYPNDKKEIGWFPIIWNPEALSNSKFKHIPPILNVLHWHGETFEIPNDALHLAESIACANQGFLFKEKVVGLQFHMEFNDKSTEEMLRYCSHELKESLYVHSAEKIISQNHNISAAKKALFGILDALV
jgi:GMP synthase (glutamine-hydrolysing)